MFKGAILLAGMFGLGQADRRLLDSYFNSEQSYSYQPSQIVSTDPYYISPSSVVPSYRPAQSTYDPYIPVQPQANSFQSYGNRVVQQPVRSFDYQGLQTGQQDSRVVWNGQLRAADDRGYQNGPRQVDYRVNAGQENKFTNIDYTYGANTGTQPAYQNSKDCPPPRAYIGGICRCPNDAIFLSNRCLARDPTPPTACLPPRTLINGECICPNNRIYTSGNSCVPAGTQVESDSCRAPRIRTVSGFCLCANNGVYSGGQCWVDGVGVGGGGGGRDPVYDRYDADGIASLGRYFRSFDGTGNNRDNPSWGSKGSVLQRRCQAFYSDSTGQPAPYLPNPRHISNELAEIGLDPITFSRNRVTAAFTFFGQFLDHDLDLTQGGDKENMDIVIPYSDKFFKASDKMGFVRSNYVMDRARMHRNMITAWIDGSQVYGSDEAASRGLRMFRDGKLKVSVEDMLPRDEKSGFFQAGDVRANQNVMLSSFHTIFLREHNRICDQIRQSRPDMDDQSIYRSARQWVIGLLQKITLEQFVPIMLGDEYESIIGKYSGYKSYINPNIPTEFATAAFRVGHSELIDFYPFINKKGVVYQNTRLSDLFLNPKYINSEKIEDAFRGMARTLQKEKSIKISDQVRNLLILDPAHKEIKLDLFSLNLQRGRDHGLPSYNEARAAYGLRKFNNFNEIQPDFDRAEKLKKVYNNRIDDVELFVGIISEEPVKNGVLGELGCRIVGQAFRNLRDGDRFWYQGTYPSDIISRIKQTTLTDLIRRNTNLNKDIQDDIWHYYNQL